MARLLRIGQQAGVSRLMTEKLHQKGAVSP
jgi:hypothetical protein